MELAPSNYHLKQQDEGHWLAVQHFETTKEFMDGVTVGWILLRHYFFDKGLQKLELCYKYLNLDGDYIEQ